MVYMYKLRENLKLNIDNIVVSEVNPITSISATYDFLIERRKRTVALLIKK